MIKITYRKKFLLTYSPRRIRVHHGGKAYQHVASMVSGGTKETELTFLTATRVQREHRKWSKAYQCTKPTPGNILVPARLHHPRVPQTSPSTTSWYKIVRELIVVRICRVMMFSKVLLCLLKSGFLDHFTFYTFIKNTIINSPLSFNFLIFMIDIIVFNSSVI